MIIVLNNTGYTTMAEPTEPSKKLSEKYDLNNITDIEMLYNLLARHFQSKGKISKVKEPTLENLKVHIEPFFTGKSVADLFTEITKGETILQQYEDGHLERQVETVHFLIPGMTDKTLIFLMEEKKDGTYCLPGGKVRCGEFPLAGVKREIKEELQLVENTHYTVVERPWKENEATVDEGRSYPFVSRYTDSLYVITLTPSGVEQLDKTYVEFGTSMVQGEKRPVGPDVPVTLYDGEGVRVGELQRALSTGKFPWASKAELVGKLVGGKLVGRKWSADEKLFDPSELPDTEEELHALQKPQISMEHPMDVPGG